MCMLVSDVVLPCLRGVCAHVGSERTVSLLVLNSVSVVGSRGLCPSGSVECVCRCWLLRSVCAHLGQRIVSLGSKGCVFLCCACVGSSGCISMFLSEGGMCQCCVLRVVC